MIFPMAWCGLGRKFTRIPVTKIGIAYLSVSAVLCYLKCRPICVTFINLIVLINYARIEGRRVNNKLSFIQISSVPSKDLFQPEN